MNEYKKREMIMERLSMYPLFWKKTPLKGKPVPVDSPIRSLVTSHHALHLLAQFFKKLMILGWENHIARAKGRGATERVFLNLGTEMDNLGRLTIELNFEVTPMTAENFLCLCTGELGLSYKCSLLHRIVPGILWQGGDITGQEGYGNKSIYGETFPDENFTLKHEEAGTVSMANCGPGSNGSQFIITARRAPALDGTNVVFGKVISGLNVLEGVREPTFYFVKVIFDLPILKKKTLVFILSSRTTWALRECQSVTFLSLTVEWHQGMIHRHKKVRILTLNPIKNRWNPNYLSWIPNLSCWILVDDPESASDGVQTPQEPQEGKDQS